MCKKVSHKTSYGAAQHIIYMEKSGKVRAGVKKMGSYYCEECQGYHITSKVRNNCLFYKNVKNVTGNNREIAKQREYRR